MPSRLAFSATPPVRAGPPVLATLPVLAALLVSCGDGPAQPPSGIPTTLSASPPALTLTAIGQTGQLRAEARDHYGDIVTGLAVAWTSDRPGTVAVDGAAGLATAISAGTATVTASAGALSARVQVTVAQEPRAIQKLTGDRQAGSIGEPLPVPVAVRVLDANGHPAGLARVGFAVTSGGGSASPASVLTDAAGQAQAVWTLGTAPAQTLAATSGSVAAEFQATARRMPLSIVTDSLPRARLTLPYAVRLEARGGSTRGYVWSLREGSELPAGLAFDSTGAIRGVPADTGVVRIETRVVDSEGGEDARELSLRVCKGPLGLAPGEARVMRADEIEGCGFFLRAAEAGAYYRVALAGTDPTQYGDDDETDGVMPVALHIEADTAGEGGAAAAARRPVAQRGFPARALRGGIPARALREIQEVERANAALHARIRRQEEELFARLAAEGRLEVLPAHPPGVGGEADGDGEPSPPLRAFRLYDPNTGASERCTVHATLNARLVTENDHIAVYQDTLAVTGISKANADRIIAYYADHGAPVIERYFGGVSDVNGDGRVVVLVNPLLPGVRGFVWSGDHTLPRSVCPTSNEMELVHMSARSFAFDNDRYWALGGLVHEVKHVSSQYMRVRHSLGVMGGTRRFFHPSWIEEGTAEIAKEMSSRLAWEAAGGPTPHARVTGALMRAGIDESYPEVYGLVSLIGRTAAAFSWNTDRPNAIAFEPRGQGHYYGSSWHFHRFLRDWFGGAGNSAADDERFVGILNDSLTAPGVRGIEGLTGQSIEDLLAGHAVAMSVAGAEDVVADGVPKFSSYDFPEVGELVAFPDPPGHYPWPVTRTGGFDEVAVLWADLAASRSFRGELGASGVRFHDFRADEAGAGATILVELADERFGVRVVVARIPDPAGS